ncbi:hypothetical protein C0J52_03933 [Blattella germanica]|nr:hypothetical protein C0J52_03933 [Blattella germanica]
MELPQRSSLPDIPLTPRERQILEQTSSCVLDHHGVTHSQSSESILNDASPPPKPPLPGSRIHHLSDSCDAPCGDPPPLPPKRRNRTTVSESQPAPGEEDSMTDTLNSSSNTSGRLAASFDRISLRSKSPEDTSSLLSASAGSLDSVLNHSREEEEIQVLMDQTSSVVNGSSSCCCWDSSSSTTSTEQPASVLLGQHPDLQQLDTTRKSPLFSTDLPPIAPGTVLGFDTSMNKLSTSHTESGFASMHSLRSSSQSYTSQQFSSRSSQQSAVSYTSTESSSKMWQVHSRTTTSSSQKVEVHSETSLSPEIDPPALPQKTRSKPRQLSTYDNVPAEGQHIVSCSMHRSSIQQGSCRSPDGKPPPLPLKKKHMFQSVAYSVMAYMEMFGNCSHPGTNEFLRHSVHTYNLLQAEWQQQEMSLTSTQSCSFSMVLPSVESAETPVSPLKETTTTTITTSSGLPPALPPKRSRTSSVKSTSSPPPISPPPQVRLQPLPLEVEKEPKKPPEPLEESNPLEELDISKYLVIKKPDEEGPDVRGGHPDSLIIHATKANKNDRVHHAIGLIGNVFFLFHALLRGERNRLPVPGGLPHDVQNIPLSSGSDPMSDLDEVLLQTLMDFVYQLLCSGDLTMAKALRVKIIEKCNSKNAYCATSMLLPSLNIYTRQASLLDFKSEQIAEQMTLLDAELFMKIEIPEVLIWAQEQNEERSPNLTRFTEHFNKMARSRILEQNEAKDRERYVVKFIKIMKHLRKINNFNSYLALLSALDSAPIRRLEWQKQITEGLKEYCALIDSSSSFRAYRQALAETQPPCIPYIGLVLQDLTFVHIGNNDLLPDGAINFSKRWQQFNIVENMKRFKKGTYSFKKHERIIAFFNNFDEFLCEEAMWQISESIKPRGGKKPQA